MKKISLYVMATFLSFTLFPLLSNAADTKPVSSLPATKPADSAEAKTLILRLDEIKSMDKSNLKATEKKALRKEVKTISNRLGEPYIYISAGSAIIIILLLIILL